MTTRFSGAAFFDVDETLIVMKSMLRLLDFRYKLLGFPCERFRRDQQALADIARSTGSREAANRAFYRLFAGCDATEIATQGSAWFARELQLGGLFNPPVLFELYRHQASGHMIVLVSGSFPACIDPIAAFIRADLAISTNPVINGGVYTGEVDEPMIGPAKAAAVRSVIDQYGFDLTDCHAYADHASDLPMLESVGNPVIVGLDPVLLGSAEARGWRSLSGALKYPDICTSHERSIGK